MNRRPTRLMLYVVLVFQLALGMSWPSLQPARATTAPHVRDPGGVPCPEHEMGLQSAAAGHVQSDTELAAHPGRTAFPAHGCCHTLGCHCYVSYPPGVSEPRISRPVALFTYLPSVSFPPPAWAPPDERFRPPIA